MSRVSLSVLLLSLLGVRPLFAQNLLVNPHFDTNLTGWSLSGGTFDGTRDANGSVSSGSARETLTLATPNTTAAGGVFQCVNGITGGASYDFGAKILLGAAPSAGSSNVAVLWFSGSGCTGLLSALQSPSVGAIGSWLPSNASTAAPALAVSAMIETLETTSATPGDFVVNFDDLFLQASASVPLMPWPWLLLLTFGVTTAAVLAIRQRFAAVVN